MTMTTERATRDALIVEAVKTTLTYAAIGADYGLTRQRIWQIADEAKMPKRGPWRRQRSFSGRFCKICSSALGSNHRFFCSRECAYRTSRLSLICYTCGAIFPRLKGALRKVNKRLPKGTVFCTLRCSGIYIVSLRPRRRRQAPARDMAAWLLRANPKAEVEVVAALLGVSKSTVYLARQRLAFKETEEAPNV